MHIYRVLRTGTCSGHEVVAKVGGSAVPVPFNLNTLHMVYGKEKADRLEQKLIETYGEGSRVPIMKLRENEDADIREIGTVCV